MSEGVTYERRGDLALITLDRPDRRNAQGADMTYAFDAAELEEQTLAIAARIAAMPSFGLTLTKLTINQAEDAMGLKQGIDAAFSLHQLAHAHNINLTGGNPMFGGLDDLRATGGSRAS